MCLQWNCVGDVSVMLYDSFFQTFQTYSAPLTVLRLFVIPPYPVFYPFCSQEHW